MKNEDFNEDRENSEIIKNQLKEKSQCLMKTEKTVK